MKSRIPIFALIIAFSMTTLVSCDIIGGIFKAGVWAGIIVVVIVVLIVGYIIAKIRRKD